MQPKGREEEPVRVARHQHRQMIIDALVQAEVRRQPMAGRKIHPGAAFRGGPGGGLSGGCGGGRSGGDRSDGGPGGRIPVDGTGLTRALMTQV